jgi:hypothetical protein
MPAYLIHHRQGQRGDILIQEDDLTIQLRNGWATFRSAGSIALAIPADQIATIQRIDPDQDGQPEDKPAPGR